jgi:hypothetical protein
MRGAGGLLLTLALIIGFSPELLASLYFLLAIATNERRKLDDPQHR